MRCPFFRTSGNIEGNMLDFYKTGGGRRFCDATMPEIGRQLKRVADQLKRANDLKEVELGIRKIGPSDLAKEFIKGDSDSEGERNADERYGRPVTPENFVCGLLGTLELEPEGITIRKVPGAGGDRDFIMLQNQKVRGLLLAAGVKIEESEEDGGEIILRKDA